MPVGARIHNTQLSHIHEPALLERRPHRLRNRVYLDAVLEPRDLRLRLARYYTLKRVVRLRIQLHRLQGRHHHRRTAHRPRHLLHLQISARLRHAQLVGHPAGKQRAVARVHLVDDQQADTGPFVEANSRPRRGVHLFVVDEPLDVHGLRARDQALHVVSSAGHHHCRLELLREVRAGSGLLGRQLSVDLRCPFDRL